MLAFKPGLQIDYEVGLTLASVAAAIGGALVALLIWRSALPQPVGVVLGGVALGLGVSAMHYLGIVAMRFPGEMLVDWTAVAASVVIPIVCSVLSLSRCSEIINIGRRLEVTLWLAIGICGLHFTGMSALTIVPGPVGTATTGLIGTTWLAATVGFVSLALLIASLGATIVEQHLSQLALKELGRMRLLSNLAHEVLLVFQNDVVVEVNSAGERLFKSNADELIGRPVLSLFTEDTGPSLLRRASSPAADRRPEEMVAQTPDGAEIGVEVSCQSIDYLGKPATAVALRDLTDRKRDEARILHFARHDALTNLPNRYNLQERLEIALETASQDGTGVAVIYLDLDRFKPVNDLYGHAAGDALLVQVSKRVLAEVQPSDVLARIGGDEFVLLLNNVSHPERVAATTHRVIDALRRPFFIEGNKIEIGASAGVALFPGDGGTGEALLRAADTAMYRMKDEGRGALRFFEPSMDAQLQARRQIEQELSGAIEGNQLVLHYQPIVNAITGEVETFEALIRWYRTARGMVPPNEFISVAEDSGLITPIGTWVIDTACQCAAAWSHPWRVSVNVSPAQFRQSDICGIVEAALKRNDLEPSRLVVEITEGVLIEDAGKAVEILRRLRDLGIRLALDDFGTGFSSLSYLQLFKFDKLKIDRSFVKRLGQNDDALTITRTIVNLGHNLGLQVTAEGVETQEQLSLLQGLGVDQVQGYLVARPAPAGSFSEFDRARTRALLQGGRARMSA